MSKLDFNEFLIAEVGIDYDEYSRLSTAEKRSIRNEYQEYLDNTDTEEEV